MAQRTSLWASLRTARFGAFCSAPARARASMQGRRQGPGAQNTSEAAELHHGSMLQTASPLRSHPFWSSWRPPQSALPMAACLAWPPSCPCQAAFEPWWRTHVQAAAAVAAEVAAGQPSALPVERRYNAQSNKQALEGAERKRAQRQRRRSVGGAYCKCRALERKLCPERHRSRFGPLRRITAAARSQQ